MSPGRTKANHNLTCWKLKYRGNSVEKFQKSTFGWIFLPTLLLFHLLTLQLIRLEVTKLWIVANRDHWSWNFGFIQQKNLMNTNLGYSNQFNSRSQPKSNTAGPCDSISIFSLKLVFYTELWNTSPLPTATTQGQQFQRKPDVVEAVR